MNSSEAFLLRKTLYGDGDYILTLFTRDFGKISGLAKHAKRSRKRFGGRLEPFVHFRVRFRDKSRDMNFIEDAETIRVFHHFIENIELFLWGSFMLELIDILLPKESPNEELFDRLAGAFTELDEGKSILPVVLDFQLQALSLAGYEPNLETCAECAEPTEGESRFSIGKGGVVCGSCGGGAQNGLLVSREFLLDKKLMEIHLAKVLQYIKLFTEFTEYHTEKELKSSKFIEELTL